MDDDVKLEFTEGQDNGKIVRLLCAKCRSRNKHTVIASSREQAEVSGMWFETRYYIARCNGCEEQKFSTTCTSSEDIGGDPEHGEFLIETIKEYPYVNISYEEPRSYFSIPLDLREIYRETYTALCSDAKKIASIGMRSMVEVICALNEITDDVAYHLPAKINVLCQRQIISPAMRDVLLSVKEFGDQSAHTLRTPRSEELKVAWDAISILVSSIYGTQDSQSSTTYMQGFRKKVKK